MKKINVLQHMKETFTLENKLHTWKLIFMKLLTISSKEKNLYGAQSEIINKDILGVENDEEDKTKEERKNNLKWHLNVGLEGNQIQQRNVLQRYRKKLHHRSNIATSHGNQYLATIVTVKKKKNKRMAQKDHRFMDPSNIYKCRFCPKEFKSLTTFLSHEHKFHPLEECSCKFCYTCGDRFSTEEKKRLHMLTPRHILNCHRLEKEMENCQPPLDAGSTWKTLHEKDRYHAYIEKIDGVTEEKKLVKKTAVRNLRKEPCIIPTESTIAQQDPRLFKVPNSFLDLLGVLCEEKQEEDEEIEGNLMPPPKKIPRGPTVIKMNEEKETEMLSCLEDIVKIITDEWIVIDSVGETPSPSSIIPPEELEDIDPLEVLCR